MLVKMLVGDRSDEFAVKLHILNGLMSVLYFIKLGKRYGSVLLFNARSHYKIQWRVIESNEVHFD